MANLHAASNLVAPVGSLGTGSGGGTIATQALEKDWVPELDVYPIVDAVNGPLLADSLLQTGDLPGSSTAPALNTTGMRFIPWNGVDQFGQPWFNYQGMVPASAPSNIQTAAGRSCLLNAFTPRFFNGSTGQYYNGHQSIRIGIAATHVVPVWYVSQGQINGAHVDMHVMVEHNGKNKHLSSANNVADGLPTVGGGPSANTYRRELTYLKHEYREHRFILSPNSYFLGVWVDTISNIQRPKNRPQLYVTGIDSWNDPQTVILDGTGWTGRDYQCLPQCVVASFRTGMCWGTDAQGGTGELNANGTTGGDVASYAGSRSSMAGSDSRCNWRATWWSGQYPIFTDVGGWNDGTAIGGLGVPYRDNYRAVIAARITKTQAACIAAGNDARFVQVGIQPVNIVSTNDVKYLAAQGQTDIPALFPGVVLGHVPLMPMWWQDTSYDSTGPRFLYCNTSDNIHLLAVGDNAVVGYYCDGIGKFEIDVAYLAKTALAPVPVVSVP